MSSISHSKGTKAKGVRIKTALTLKKPFNKAYLKDKRPSRESLVASQKMYRDLVEMAHEGIIMADFKDNLIFVNKQFAKSVGYKVSELIGRSLFSITTKTSGAKMESGTESRKKGEKSRYEVVLIHRDGSQKHFWLSASPMYGPSHEFIGSMAVFSDVTEKKIMEKKLEKRVKQIDTLYRVYEHARMINSLGTVLNGITQAVVQAFSHSEYVQSKLVFDKKTYSYPKKLKRFVRKIEFPLFIAGVKRGTLQVGYNKKVSCVTKNHSLDEERKLIKNVAEILCKHMYARGVLNRHREIIKKSFTSIIIVHGQKIAYVNPRFFRMFKCRGRQIIGRNIHEFLPMYKPCNGTGGRVRECTGKRTGGERFDLARITQRINYHGKSAVLIRVNDISALKKAQDKLNNFNRELRKTVKEKTLHLEEANKRLQSINQLKDEFIAITSHELRSPLTSIRGYLSFLVEDDFMDQISEPYREYLKRAYSTTDSLNYLINNILDVSRLDMDRFELQKQETDIIRLTRNILDSLSFQVNERRLKLEFKNCTKQEEVVLLIDSIRISQVLRNVLDNAIKFTKRGKKIKVSIKRNSKEICIAIADQGVGIPKSKLDQIFDKFVQVKNMQTKYKGGVGLGLFIAKCIVELHGGKIKASKNDDGGTTISIYLPLEH